MPSRRTLLAGVGIIAGSLAGVAATDGPVTIGDADGPDWPTARFDAAGTGGTTAISGPQAEPEVLWEAEPSGYFHRQVSLALVGDTLFATDRDGITAVDRDTGRIRYERTGGSYTSPMLVETDAYRSDALVVGGRSGVSAIDIGGGYSLGGRTIGFERWTSLGQQGSSGVTLSSTPSMARPVAVDGTVFATDERTERAVALDGNSGRVRWERSIADLPSRDPLSVTPRRPAVYDGTVYVSSWPHQVDALDAATGEVRWTSIVEPDGDGSSVSHRVFGPPSVTDSGVVVLTREAVVCLDPADGSERWSYEHGGNITEGETAVVGETVFAPDGEGAIHAIDLADGEQLWMSEEGSGHTPVVAGDVVYWGGSPWYGVTALDATTGEHRWSYHPDDGPSRPIVGDGVVYAVGDRRIVALGDGGDDDG